MSSVERKLRKLVWQERLRNLKGILVLLAIVGFLVSSIYYFNRGGWKSSEIEVVMKNIVVQEDDTQIMYRALVEKSNGTLIHVKIPQSSHFKEGRKVIVMESVNLESGRKRYRYLHPSTDS